VNSSLLDFTKANLPEDQALTDKIARWENELSRLRSKLVFIDRLTGRTFAVAAERKALLQEQAQLRQALMAQDETLQNLRAELLAIHQSWLWRWTKSLRTLLGPFHWTK
jgi:hypothetical protein